MRIVSTFADIDDVLQQTWLELTGRLLRFCWQNQPSPERWELLGGEPDVTIAASSIGIRAALLGARTPDRGESRGPTDEEEQVGLAFASEVEVGTLQVAIKSELDLAGTAWSANGGDEEFLALAVARGAAEAIDSLFGHTFIQPFRDEGEVNLVPGEIYPVVPHNPSGYVDEYGPNTNPASLPTRNLAQTRRLRVADQTESGLRYVLDFEHWNQLAPLGASGGLVLAVGQPNLTLNEFDIEMDAEANFYFNRGPKNPEAQAAAVIAQIQAAGRHGVDILVLPEYALDWRTRHLVEVQLDELDVRPQIVVGGYVEGSESSKFLDDRAWLGVLGRTSMQAKSASLPSKTSNAPFEGMTEGIRRGSEVRFLVTREWTIAVPICLDSMSHELWSRAIAVGVNLAVIPAMSAKTTSMLQMVGAMRAATQAFIVVANGPAHWVASADDIPAVRGGEGSPLRVEGGFGGPYGHAGADWVLLPSRATNPPGVRPEADAELEVGVPNPTDVGIWVFRSSDRSCQWVSTLSNG